jgi:hypothetical protein
MDELRAGLWTWTGRHPDWKDDPHWGPDVRSYALDTGNRLLLFDPISPPAELIEGRELAVVLTARWHGRSANDLGAPVHDQGDPLPDGVEAKPAFFLPEERTLWLRSHRALVAGDSLPAAGAVPDAWLDVPREEYNAKLRPLLDLPLELLLPTHGDPIVDNAHEHLARALA